MGPSVNFLNFPCIRRNFRQLSSTLRASEGTSSTLCASVQPSVNFCQLSVRAGDLPSISISFPFILETLSQLPSTFCTVGRPSFSFRLLSVWPVELAVWLRDLPSTYVNFTFSRKTFCQILSTFHVAGRPSVSLSQLSLTQKTFRQLPLTFRTARLASVVFRQLSVLQGDLP